MSPEEVAALQPVGEFGSQAWCQACAEAGIHLLREGGLPADLAWAFSEIYTDPPARLVTADRPMSGYYLMVKDGEITGGDGVPPACRELPGFHVTLPWAAICNQSGSKYGGAGQEQRREDEQVMYQQIADYLGHPLPLEPRGEAVWPPAVRAAVSRGRDQGAGLHNIAAALQSPSPEFAEMPTTELGVPLFAEMTDAQKQTFLGLLRALPQ